MEEQKHIPKIIGLLTSNDKQNFELACQLMEGLNLMPEFLEKFGFDEIQVKNNTIIGRGDSSQDFEQKFLRNLKNLIDSLGLLTKDKRRIYRITTSLFDEYKQVDDKINRILLVNNLDKNWVSIEFVINNIATQKIINQIEKCNTFDMNALRTSYPRRLTDPIDNDDPSLNWMDIVRKSRLSAPILYQTQSFHEKYTYFEVKVNYSL